MPGGMCPVPYASPMAPSADPYPGLSVQAEPPSALLPWRNQIDKKLEQIDQKLSVPSVPPAALPPMPMPSPIVSGPIPASLIASAATTRPSASCNARCGPSTARSTRTMRPAGNATKRSCRPSSKARKRRSPRSRRISPTTRCGLAADYRRRGGGCVLLRDRMRLSPDRPLAAKGRCNRRGQPEQRCGPAAGPVSRQAR